MVNLLKIEKEMIKTIVLAKDNQLFIPESIESQLNEALSIKEGIVTLGLCLCCGNERKALIFDGIIKGSFCGEKRIAKPCKNWDFDDKSCIIQECDAFSDRKLSNKEIDSWILNIDYFTLKILDTLKERGFCVANESSEIKAAIDILLGQSIAEKIEVYFNKWKNHYVIFRKDSIAKVDYPLVDLERVYPR